MLHDALPQTMTPENLAVWITENKIDQVTHVEETELSVSDISEYEHKSSMASRTMDDLKELKKKFTDMIKGGTEEPFDFTIPPTKGLTALESQRAYADKCIKEGVTKEEKHLYAIPFPETNQILFFDIEGREYDSHQRDMNEEEIEKYARPLLKAVKGGEEPKQLNFTGELDV